MRFVTYTNSLDSLSLPEWMRTERYMYCDNFVNDYMKSFQTPRFPFSHNALILSRKTI